MLNIMSRPKTQKVQLTIKLSDKQFRIYHLPKEFVNRRFGIEYTKDTVTIFPDENGVMCCEAGANNHVTLRFGKRRLPFVAFEAKRIKMEAVYDGNSIVFAAPKYEPIDAKNKKQTKTKFEAFREVKTTLEAFREAINSVNEFTKQFNGIITVKNNQISVTIQKEI